jgi:hypothetical protein
LENYADPDGNQIEFTVDAFPAKAEASAYFRSGSLDANPVGIEYDHDCESAWNIDPG